MGEKKKGAIKQRLHSRNKNRERYDLTALIAAVPELENHLQLNKMGEQTVDFSSPQSVKLLNQALLHHYYGIDFWQFPDHNLCPPIPGRADYLHYLADLLGDSNYGKLPTGNRITGLDIGVGASCIYPILGVTEYNWNFIASDVNPDSIESSQNIIDENSILKGKIELRLQKAPKDVFFGLLGKEEKVDFAMCNPPFHSSAEEAIKGTKRKIKNLSNKKEDSFQLNFSGELQELVFEGGESRFIQNMIRESQKFATNCYWYSTLVSKQSNLKGIYKSLDSFGASHVKTIPIGTGNKSSRIVAWTFLNSKEQKEWRESRWQNPTAPSN